MPGDEVAVIETIKVNLSLLSPIAGKVIETNPALETTPELVNQDPYGQGWLSVLEVEDPEAAKRSLKTAREYLSLAKHPGRSRGLAMSRKIPVVACSGIGKALGAAAREAAYILAEDLAPRRREESSPWPSSSWATTKRSAKWPAERPWPSTAASSNAPPKGSNAPAPPDVRKVAVFDVVRRHRGLKPEGVCDLNADGLKLARAAAEEGAADRR